MSNFAKEAYLNGRAIVGPEVVNGTGEVHLDIPAPIDLSGEEARELAAAIIGAAEYAEQRKQEVDE